MTLFDDFGAIPPASNHIPDKVKTVSVEKWRDRAIAMGISTGEDRAQRKAFQSATEALVADRKAAIWQTHACHAERVEPEHSEQKFRNVPQGLKAEPRNGTEPPLKGGSGGSEFLRPQLREGGVYSPRISEGAAVDADCGDCGVVPRLC
jgi:hypothetical protein